MSTVEPTTSYETPQPNSEPSPAFEASVSTHKTSQPLTTEGEPYGNTPNWVDADGDGSEWYEKSGELPGCPIFGET